MEKPRRPGADGESTERVKGPVAERTGAEEPSTGEKGMEMDKKSWQFSEGTGGAFLDADDVKLDPESAIKLAATLLSWAQNEKESIARRRKELRQRPAGKKEDFR